MAWSLRKGTREDIPALLTLTKEFAVSLGFNEGVVKFREEDLLRDGFDTFLKFLIAEWLTEGDSNAKPEMIGYSFYYTCYAGTEGRMVYIEDIYVKKEYQRKGIGRAFMKKAAEMANDLKCCKLGWSCLDDNTEGLKFYYRLGAKMLDQLTQMEIEGREMKKLLSNPVQLSPGVGVRFGVQEDIPAVYTFMKELAVVNGDTVTVSETDLVQDGFTDPKYFYVVVAEKTVERNSGPSGHEIIGFSTYFFAYSWAGLIIYMEDLYVKEEDTENSVGMALMKKIAEFAEENNCCRIAWSHRKDNIPALKFYERLEATPQPRGRKMYLDKSAIANLLA